MLLMGKLTISMAMFKFANYNKLPEGIFLDIPTIYMAFIKSLWYVYQMVNHQHIWYTRPGIFP